MSLKLLKIIVISMILLVTILPQTNSNHAQNNQAALPILVGLTPVRLNGFIDSQLPSNVVGEWGDAFKDTIVLQGSQIEIPDVMVYFKVVGDRILIGLDLPSTQNTVDFVKILIALDISGDGELNQGDARVTIAKDGSYFVEAYGTNGFELIEDIQSIGLNEQLPYFAPAAIARAASSQHDSRFQIEMELTRSIFAKFVDVFIKDTIPGVLGRIGYSIIYLTTNQIALGYPDLPSELVRANNEKDYVIAKYNDFIFDLEIPAGYGLDIGIDKIEVTQTIQDGNNDLRLVLNKPTLARVYINNPSLFTIDVEVTLYLDGNLLGWPMMLLDSMTKTGTVHSTYFRDNLNSSINFELPAAWISENLAHLRAIVTPLNFIDSNTINNEAQEFAVFVELHDLNIYYIEVNEASLESPSLVSDIDSTFIPRAIDDFRALYPQANPNFIPLGWETLGVFHGDGEELKQELTRIVGELGLAILFQILTGTPEADLLPIPDQIVGFRTTGSGSSTPEWGGYSANYASWVGLDSERGPMSVAHEINHNLGNIFWGKHVDGCSSPDLDTNWPTSGESDIGALYSDSIGWNQNTKELVSTTTPDFMSYCIGSDYPHSWMSDYRWEQLIDRLYNFEGTVRSHRIVNVEGETREVRWLSFADKSAVLYPSRLLDGTVQSTISSDPNGTPTHYLKINFTNQTQQIIPISAVFNTSDINSNSMGFTYWISDNGEIFSIILEDTDQNQLGSLYSTGFSLQGSFGVPQQVTRGNKITFDLQATLTNTTRIFTQLQYAHDGKTWMNLGPQTTGDLPAVSIGNLPGGPTALFRVEYSDGFDSIYLNGSNPVFVSDLPAVVRINSKPLTTDSTMKLTRLSSFSLSASAFDPENGELLDSSSFQWEIIDSANSVPFQALGQDFNYRFALTGIYTVRVSYLGVNGIESSDEIKIEIINPKFVSKIDYDQFKLKQEELREQLTVSSQSVSTNSSKLNSESSSDPKPLPYSFMLVIPVILILGKLSSRGKQQIN